ncbi:ABC transporter permease [Amycolatopsis saalfeldensis]|uniref:ABC-2 type transport system permease protein n=1 Tax=Amycolatopsis saalfeldensis TaxID=394193 RepID=A0A1H8RJW6_9PSEU|nr:ABC transporter permease [Amycolatopsis saalfeldensis]SEO66263.1 ABC-2 type transport system permease protein [Amycolatopsis saalfeldensis]
MTWLGYARAQFLLSQQVYWKRIGIALTGTLVPLVLGGFMPFQLRHGPAVDGAPAGMYALTGFLAFALFFTVYTLVNAVTSRRDALVYKRLRAASLPDSAIFAGEGAAASLPGLIVAVLLIVFGLVALDAGAPANPLLLVVGLVLGVAMFALLAVGISGILPSADTSMWIVTPVMVLFMFCSGIYAPLSSLPGPLADAAVYLPMAPVVSIVRTAYLGADFAGHNAIMGLSGAGAPLGFAGQVQACIGPLCVTVAWAVIGLSLARKFFRWDPKRSGR